MTKIEEYAEEIPEEIRRAIRGLDSNYRAAIFVALYKHGDLSFSDLREKLEIDKAMLNYHLGKLIESALVQHYYKHELGTEKYSFYNVSPFGQNFVEILSRFLRPQPYTIPLDESSTTPYIISVDNLLMDQFDVVILKDEVGRGRSLESFFIECLKRCTPGTYSNDSTDASNPTLGFQRQEKEKTALENRLIQSPTI